MGQRVWLGRCSWDTKFGRGVYISWIHLKLKLLSLRASAAMCRAGTGVLYTCLGVIIWGIMWVFIVIARLEGPLSHRGSKGTAEEEIRLY